MIAPEKDTTKQNKETKFADQEEDKDGSDFSVDLDAIVDEVNEDQDKKE